MKNPFHIRKKVKDALWDKHENYIEYLGVILAILASIFGFLALEYGQNVLPHFDEVVLVLLEKTFVILGIAYIITRSKFFGEILDKKFTLKNMFLLIIILGALSIFANHTGADYLGVNGNVRDLAPLVGGLVAGPFVGICVGIIGSVDRFLLGGPLAIPCSIATLMAGILSGIIYVLNKGKFVGIFYAVILAALFELFHELFALLVINSPDPFKIISQMGIQMIIANAIGMLIFALLISNEIKKREMARNVELYREEADLYASELEVIDEIKDKFWKFQISDIQGIEIKTLNITKEFNERQFYDFVPKNKNKFGLIMGHMVDNSLVSVFIGTFILTVFRNGIKEDMALFRIIKFLEYHLLVYKEFKILISMFISDFDLKNMIFKYTIFGDIIALFYSNKRDEIEILNKYPHYLDSKNIRDVYVNELKLEKEDLIFIISYNNFQEHLIENIVEDSLKIIIEEIHKASSKELEDKIKKCMDLKGENNVQMSILILQVK